MTTIEDKVSALMRAVDADVEPFWLLIYRSPGSLLGGNWVPAPVEGFVPCIFAIFLAEEKAQARETTWAWVLFTLPLTTYSV